MEWHKNLDAEQYKILTEPENKLQYIQFTARVSKNIQRGLKHKNVKKKIKLLNITNNRPILGV